MMKPKVQNLSGGMVYLYSFLVLLLFGFLYLNLRGNKNLVFDEAGSPIVGEIR